MAFRPAGVLIFCLCLTIIIAIPCVAVMFHAEKNSGGYGVAMAILTGVIASGLVSVSIELANNYRHNRQRFVVLNEYLYMVSMYESFVEWGSHGEYEKIDQQADIDWFKKDIDLTKRISAVAEVILEFGTVIEKAVLDGREYMSIKELQIATRAVDAADKLGEVISDIISHHFKSRDYEIYDVLDEPLREKIGCFSEDVGIYIVNEHVENVVCDYFLSNLDDLLTLSDDEFVHEMDCSNRNQIIHCLWNFDQSMHQLQTFIKFEPVVFENLIPFEKRLEKMERKLYGKAYDAIIAEREKNHSDSSDGTA